MPWQHKQRRDPKFQSKHKGGVKSQILRTHKRRPKKMTKSNLPPGCSSPDGGLDHAWIAASDELLEAIETPNCAAFLTLLAPMVEKLMADAYAAGHSDGSKL